MNRDQMLKRLTECSEPWDIIIIGGGATGLGAAVDAATRGYRTLLLEQSDFAKGTSSRSTKLIHGGVRYLQQGNLKLVRESLRERGLLTRNAPHLVGHLAFIVPNYTWWEGPFYGTGLKIYDTLAGKLGLGPSKHLSRKETLAHLPTLEPKGLRGGTIYYDGQFDDARLAITLAQTAVDLSGTVINYMQVTGFLKTSRVAASPDATRFSLSRPTGEGRGEGTARKAPSSATALESPKPSPLIPLSPAATVRQRGESDRRGEADAHAVICGVVARDLETGREYEIRARVVVNATGIFTDTIRRLDEPTATQIMAQSQGAHIVLDRAFLPGDSAIMVPKTDDHRVLFAIPWHGRVLIGTTETAVPKPQLEPRPLREEIEFLLKHAARYLTQDPRRKDVLSAFAGLRPLVKAGKTRDTALVPRDHVVMVSKSGLVTVTGGKWTTYRKMAEDTVDRAAQVGRLAERPCTTTRLRLHGWVAARVQKADVNDQYGSDTPALLALMHQTAGSTELLHPTLPYKKVEVLWAVRHEMARTIEDVLARRTRLLFLDARASMTVASNVARWMAAELGRDEKWEREQVAEYRDCANGYLV